MGPADRDDDPIAPVEPGTPDEPVERDAPAEPDVLRHPLGLDRPLPVPPTRPLRTASVLLALVAAAGIALATALVGIGPAEVDGPIRGEALDRRSGALTAVAVAVTDAGSGVAMTLLAGFVIIWLLRARRNLDAVFVAVTGIGAGLLSNGLKQLLARVRPPESEHLVGVSSESLPSGHALVSVAVIGSLVVLAWPALGRVGRVLVAAAAICWSGSVGLTRIYLGVHWFSDVLAGWLVGAAWVAVCTVLVAVVRRRTSVSS